MNENHDPEDPLLLPHDADGIKELDNNLPRWWVWLFYLSIAYSIVYMLYYHVFGMGDLQAAAYLKEMEKGEKLKQIAVSEFEASISSLEPSEDPAVLDVGLQIYTTYCAPCHRPDGGGLAGPNLCDDYWIHGSEFSDHIKIILSGVPEKGMLTWRGVLKPSEIHAVASYIQKFQGTSPPNPKPPENQQVPEEPSIYE